MNPNDQQEYTQPNPVQPGVAVVPPAPQPLAPLGQPSPVVDPAALQAALNEPVQSVAAAPQPQPAPLPEVQQSSEQLPPEEEGEEYDDDEEDDEGSEAPVTWMAHEYIHREKGTMWFAIFGVVVVVLLGVSIFLMGSWSFAALLAVIAVVVVVYSRRPPRELNYMIDDEGLTIDSTLHKFSSFKSFGVIHDGDQFSVMLIPTQRFQPAISVYFPEEAGEDIVDMLGGRLPMKELHLDIIDRITRILRL
jgi:hypothetical protein